VSAFNSGNKQWQWRRNRQRHLMVATNNSGGEQGRLIAATVFVSV
jgi:hypothetical protein